MEFKNIKDFSFNGKSLSKIYHSGGVVWNKAKQIKPEFEFILKDIDSNPNFVKTDGEYYGLNSKYADKYIVFAFPNNVAAGYKYVEVCVEISGLKIKNPVTGGSEKYCILPQTFGDWGEPGKRVLIRPVNDYKINTEKNYLFVFNTKEELHDSEDAIIEFLDS